MMETAFAQPQDSIKIEFVDVNLSLDEPLNEDKSVLRLGSNTPIGANDTGQSSLFKCDICLYETSNEAQFSVHKKVHLKAYRCDSCRYICGSKTKLLNHKKKLHFELEDLLYFCGDCDFTAPGREAFKRHRRDQHQKKYTGKFHCSSCNFRSDNLRMLEKHSKTHLSLEERRVQCSQCNFSSVTEKTMREHARKVHSELFLICDICHRTYKHNEVEDYEAHVNIHNWPREDGRFMCKLCKYSALHMPTLKRHIMEKHEGKKLKKKGRHRCEKCPFITHKQHLYELHMENHTKDNYSLQCPKCPYIAFSVSTLGKHQKNYHKEEIL